MYVDRILKAFWTYLNVFGTYFYIFWQGGKIWLLRGKSKNEKFVISRFYCNLNLFLTHLALHNLEIHYRKLNHEAEIIGCLVIANIL